MVKYKYFGKPSNPTSPKGLCDSMSKDKSNQNWLLVSVIAGLAAMAFAILLYILPWWLGRIVLIIGVVVFLVVLLRNPRYFYRRILATCLGLISAFALMPSIQIFLKVDESFGSFLLDNPTGAIPWVCGIALACVGADILFNRPQNNQQKTNSPVKQNIDGNNNTVTTSVDSSIGKTIDNSVKNYFTYQQAPAKEITEAKIDKAKQRFAELPLDKVPEPQDLPKGSKMPHPVNPNFVGREKELKELAKNLKEGANTAITATTGIGGIGKSQLAAEFVHRYGSCFEGGVFWLSFSDPNSIPAEVAECGSSEHLAIDPNFANFPLEEQVRLVSSHFKSGLPKLLVFDNCEDTQLLANWRPTQGGSRVLLTSRYTNWKADTGVKAVALKRLTRPQSIELLKKYRPDVTNDITLDKIAHELGDLPLALQLAGNFLEQYQHSDLGVPENYLEALTSDPLVNHPSLRGVGSESSATRHELNVAKTFALSFDQLDKDNEIDNLAIKLLERAAHFAPEGIPRELLIATLNPENEETTTDEKLAMQDALNTLVNLGLLETEENGDVRQHRLIASFVRQESQNDAAQTAVEQTMQHTVSMLNSEGYPAPVVDLQVHLRYITDVALKRKDELAASLANTLGYHLYMVANYPEATEYFKQSLEINEKVLGAEHPDTAMSLNNLGGLLRSQGDYAGAKPYYERALEINEKVLGAEHPDTAMSLNNLGMFLHEQGDSKTAKLYLTRAVDIYEKLLGQDHPNTKIMRQNLESIH